jgi:5-methyltetrahydropteroyltriglutamate--homocysteine methyltransferase
MKSHLTGTFPRPEELVRVTRAFERHKLEKEELDEATKRAIIHLLDLQKKASLDYIVDGQLNWQDSFRPFSQICSGIRAGALTRWYDNNTFYRQPIIAEKVRYVGTGLKEYFRYDLIPSDAAKKAILPGPYTFAYSSQRPWYNTFADLVDDLAHAFHDTCRRLSEFGYTYFQFDEPALTFHKTSKDELTIAKNAFEILGSIPGAKTCLQTYFGDVTPLLESLLEFKTDGLGIDFYATSMASIQNYRFDKELGCGCVDGRNSLLESPRDLINLLQKVKSFADEMSVCPNCALEFLPYSVAEKKVQLLAETKTQVDQS